MIEFFREITSRKYLLWLMTKRNLNIRYKRSFLGFFWSLLSPLAMILIYAVFARILRFNLGKPDYLQFLVVGLLVWQFLLMCLNDSLSSVVGNTNLVKKAAFPRIILPLSMTLANLINFMFTMMVLFVYLAFSRSDTRCLYALPLVVLTQWALCVGAALILSAMNVFFRDIEHILGIVTLAWFFLTPVFYPLELQLQAVPAVAHALLFLNPMTGIVCAYRFLLLSDPFPGWAGIAISALISWALMGMGLILFRHLQPRFADEL